MITFVLAASRIPDGTHVRKVTGQNEYVLKRTLSIYMPDKHDPQKIETQGVVFLTSESTINGYADTTKFAVDVADEDAQDFLQTVLGNDEK